jgi:threonine aldolase
MSNRHSSRVTKSIENSHNRGGGVVFPQNAICEICEKATALQLATYLDGARLFNAAAATSVSLAALATAFDLVSVALSKELGCPVGSALAGRSDHIARAIRVRRTFGGAMRQAGILAAAGLYALDHDLRRLSEEHANARLIAERIASLPRIELDLATVQTNMRPLPQTSWHKPNSAACFCRPLDHADAKNMPR